jgi:hypothetical protein
MAAVKSQTCRSISFTTTLAHPQAGMAVRRDHDQLCQSDAAQAALRVASHVLSAFFFAPDAHGDLRRTIVRFALDTVVVLRRSFSKAVSLASPPIVFISILRIMDSTCAAALSDVLASHLLHSLNAFTLGRQPQVAAAAAAAAELPASYHAPPLTASTLAAHLAALRELHHNCPAGSRSRVHGYAFLLAYPTPVTTCQSSLVAGERALSNSTAPLLASLAWHLSTQLDVLDETASNLYEQVRGTRWVADSTTSKSFAAARHESSVNVNFPNFHHPSSPSTTKTSLCLLLHLMQPCKPSWARWEISASACCRISIAFGSQCSSATLPRPRAFKKKSQQTFVLCTPPF